MEKDEKKVNFDLSKLSLSELIKVYEEITEYIALLNDSKIQDKEEKNE